VSGTALGPTPAAAVWTPPIADLCIEVFEQCGLQIAQASTEQYASFRRSANLIQLRWLGRGVSLFKMVQWSVPLTQGQTSVPVDPAVFDIFDVIRRTTFGTPPTQTDIALYPLSRGEYTDVPNKLQQGPPTSYWFNKAPAAGPRSLYLWPAVDAQGSYTLLYWAFMRIGDAAPENGGLLDVREAFWYAWVSEVAAHFALKWAPERLQVLAANATTAWTEAANADTERVPFRVWPDLSPYFNS